MSDLRYSAGPENSGLAASAGGRPTASIRRHLEAAAAAAFDVAIADLRSRTRGRARTAFARQTAMYAAHVVFGLSYAETGRLFGRDRTTAAHACRRVEERRDDHDIDLAVIAVEAACIRFALQDMQ